MARAEREQAERRITHAVPVQALGLQVRATQLSEVLFWAARAITPSVREQPAAWPSSPVLHTLPTPPRC